MVLDTVQDTATTTTQYIYGTLNKKLNKSMYGVKSWLRVCTE